MIIGTKKEEVFKKFKGNGLSRLTIYNDGHILTNSGEFSGKKNFRYIVASSINPSYTTSGNSLVYAIDSNSSVVYDTKIKKLYLQTDSDSSPLYVDFDLNFSTERFENSLRIPTGIPYELDFKNKEIKEAKDRV